MCKRCDWPKTHLEIKYHDEEWCVPEYCDKKIYEFFVLESMQAGLSWAIILNKRESMREAFSNFSVEKIADYDDEKINELLNNKNIIRNKLKLKALVNNAKVFIDIQKEFGSFSNYIWSFTNNKQIKNNIVHQKDMPVTTELSEKISKCLISRGVTFFGPLICYSFLQAIGIVDDHMECCFKNEH